VPLRQISPDQFRCGYKPQAVEKQEAVDTSLELNAGIKTPAPLLCLTEALIHRQTQHYSN